MKKALLIQLLFMLLSVSSYGQQAVSGKVTDSDGFPVPGVNVLQKGTSNGTVTDIDGNYSLTLPSDAVISFTYIGFITQEIPVQSRGIINVELVEDITSLNEVVVVGYGTTTKKELTGAVSSVKGENLEKLNAPRIENALQGQFAGVNVTSNSGSPGGDQNINIRGFSTNGNASPLIVVDGIIYDDGLSALNPNDIESIDVLKDATAGIYGVQAANGVIMITTKKGRKNQKAQVSLDAYYGVQETSKKLDIMNATEYAVIKNEAAAANGDTPPFANTNLGEGTDWQDEVFETAPIQSYNLTVRGGTSKSTYSIGGTYFDQKGIVGGDKSSYTRYNGRINFSTDLSDNLTFENILLYTNEERKTLPENVIGSVLFNALNNSPIFDVYDENGDFTYADGIGDVINPIAQMANTFNESFTNKVTGKLGLDWEINDAFSVTGRVGYNYADVKFRGFSPLVYYGAGKAQNTALNADLDPTSTEIAPGTEIDVPNNVTQSNTTYFNYNFDAFLNYEETFNDVHKVKATIGTSIYSYSEKGLFGTAYNVPYNSWEFAYISAADGANLLNSSSAYQFESRLLSYFIRGEYNYEDKYLLSAMVRRDGSSRFGPNNKVGYFPTFSAAWVLSEEDFFSPNGFIDFFKIRASYGVSGNDRIGNWAYRGLLDGEAVYPFNNQLTTGRAIGLLGNPDLRWEQTSQLDFGIDLDILEGDLSMSLDYYIKTTTDLLFQPEVSAIVGAYGAGGQPPFVNAGEIQNKGFELGLNYRKRISDNFNFNVNYNLATYNNEVTGLFEGADFLSRGEFSVGGINPTRMEVGFPLGYFVGLQTNGIFQNQAEIDNAPTQEGAQPGDLRFVDVNGDGMIDFSGNTDRVQIGSPIPDFTMGLTLSAEAYGFDFSAFLYASIGNDIVRNYERQTPLANLMSYKLDRWTGEGTSNSEPRITNGPNRNNVFSDYFVEDGSYLRLKNIQIGYSLPSRVIENIGFERVRLYVSANNLFTLTDYMGYDPDVTSSNPLAAGIDYGFYPQARTYMFGVNLNF
ncbi:SusC/RagA family TonB-linked outer membrane protein [Marinigracilibium pacificum]|uniref:TonB-dependent receptor n=1 Tax=Marinigracilibium pacificum TaxID=2729599 RepID=A0A848IW25_9BACT|nr:TonB-dependent receptor [Marinigracilibium pacificum]NMM48537.1 TonB-dependent receptor [Marinigracilibium pacificum]